MLGHLIIYSLAIINGLVMMGLILEEFKGMD